MNGWQRQNECNMNGKIHTASDQGILPFGPLVVEGIGFTLGFAGVTSLPLGCQDDDVALGSPASSSSLNATRVEVAWRALILAAAET